MQNPLEKTKLVLLPGLDGTGELFKPFVEQFPEPDNIITMTYPTERFIPFEDLAEYIFAKLPQGQPLVLLGESYSGPVAAVLANHEQLDVRGVIFVATFARFPASLLKSMSRLVPLSWLLRLPIPDSAIRWFCFGKLTTPALSHMLRSAIKLNRPDILAQRARSGASLDVQGELAQIAVPCLYIQAHDDRLVPANAVDAFKTRVEDLNVQRVVGPHFILQSRPDACYDIIKNFVNGLA